MNTNIFFFPDVPTRTNKLFLHGVDVGDAKPVKQHPYRSNPVKQQILKEEIKYLLENDFIEPSKSECSSPYILVSKPDGSFTDYRKDKVMPFRVESSSAMFQRPVNKVISGLGGVWAYIDDVIIYSDIWEEHLRLIRTFFYRPSVFQLTVNLNKSEFCHEAQTFIGHVVGQDQVKPIFTKYFILII